MTAKQEQEFEHRRWKLQPRFANVKWFDDLLTNEFAKPDAHRLWLQGAMKQIVRFAATQVPFYRSRWTRLDIDVQAVQTPQDLPLLPVLTRRDVIGSFNALRPANLPDGVRVISFTQSSGTTGPPVRVLTTELNSRMFTLLWHRQARNFRMDPMGVLCEIRDGSDVLKQSDGSPNPNGRIVKLKRWKYAGSFFETGRECAFNITNDHARQLEWLKQFQPDYLLTDASMLEELALANGGRSPSKNIKAVLALGSQISSSTRRQLERIYGVPVHQTYGLNEIGKVAVRCSEGRYHVHIEQCHVEIVDDDGKPCVPGEVGRIVVTALRNPAMPLIRYDTGDLATVVDGPCPCGRVLPSFGEIIGRYRRYAGLPTGTRERFDAIQAAIADSSLEALTFLRQFQLHQFRDNRFELRLATNGRIPEHFEQAIHRAWSVVNAEQFRALDIVRVDFIARSPGGKPRDFTSDLHEKLTTESA